jgi:hypothetical protein
MWLGEIRQSSEKLQFTKIKGERDGEVAQDIEQA